MALLGCDQINNESRTQCPIGINQQLLHSSVYHWEWTHLSLLSSFTKSSPYTTTSGDSIPGTIGPTPATRPVHITNPGFPLISGCVVILYVRASCRLLIWCYNFIYFTGNFDDSCPCAVEMGITSIIIEQKRCIQRIRDALYNLHSYRSQLDYYSRFLRPGRRIIFLTVFQRAISYTPIDWS